MSLRRLWPLATALLVSAVAAGTGTMTQGSETAETAPTKPQEADDHAATAEEERLRQIRSQIEELRQRLVESESQAGSLLDALDEIDLKVAVLGREAIVLRSELDSTRRAEAAARLEADAARERVTAAEQSLRRWLVEIDRAGSASQLRLLLASANPSTLAVAERAGEALALAERTRVRNLRSEQARLESAQQALQSSRTRLASLQDELQARQSELAAARSGKQELLHGIRAREEVGQQALASLVQVEKDLVALLGSLPGGGTTPSYGLPRFHGLLNWPVPGPVAIPFGNVRHPKFSTQVPHPGLEIACPDGESVHALFDGKVVFSSWFRGYGQMIVIDHGDEYLSIYGQLGDRLVEAGDEVHRDQLIARSGGEGTFGVTGLYLEIRHHGRPEDPQPWLRKVAGRPSTSPEKRR
jgi:septal ring factor EnvC (AmiA/AmiB activator)